VACSGSAPPDTGTQGDELAAGALAGHWDVVGSDADGLTTTGTLDVTKTSLTVSFGNYSFQFNDDGHGATALWNEGSPGQLITTAIPTIHAAQPVNAGIIPLSLGGDWSVLDPNRPGAGCTAYLSGDGFASQCQNVKLQPSAGDFYSSHPYPYWAWNGWDGSWWDAPPEIQAWSEQWTHFWNQEQVPSPNGDFTGVRLRTLKSSFGDLGGEWELAGSGGVACHATLSGTTFTSDCDGISGWESQSDANGSITIRFGNGIASGSTSKGIELAARRVHS
jgi:hypothetical protein